MRQILVFDARQWWWKKKLLIASTVMMVASAIGLGVVYEPLGVAELRYWVIQESKVNKGARLPAPDGAAVGGQGFGELLAAKLEAESASRRSAPDAFFSIVIPKIQARSKVIANVDAGSKREYLAALKRGVAHAAGTGLPGVDSQVNRTIVLFAHSTDAPWNMARYNAVFYLLNKLDKGDRVEVYFQGVKHEYRVEESRVVSAGDVSYFVKQTREEILVLQTCYPPGTTWKRLLVIARPI